jgi:hypothetical protein
MPLPHTIAEVTGEWLTENLRRAGVIDGDVTVVDVRPDPFAAGVGFMGEVGAIDLTYDRSTGAPSRMIAKIPTRDATVRGLLAPARVFEREARFYEDVAPRLGDLVPDCYFVGRDVEADDYFLLLEDLGANRCGDQAEGCSIPDARAAIEAIARFHARFWENDDLAAIDWMPRADSEGMKVGEVVYSASIDGFKAIFADVIEPRCAEIIDRFGPNVPQLLDRLASMPHTIAHFDYRLDNLFFDGSGGVQMIDFQTSSKGGGIYDVGYLMSQSLNVEDRRAHEHELLELYHDTLVEEGVRGYGLDQIASDYRVAVLYSWVIPVFAVGSLDVSSERAMTLWTRVIERAQAAIIDHDCGELLTV